MMSPASSGAYRCSYIKPHLEAAELIELFVEKVHCHAQHRGDAQSRLLMPGLHPKAHVAEAHTPVDLKAAR
eukprot:scaffold16485_cov65-Phaeocystis_antarctica.AAC.13